MLHWIAYLEPLKKLWRCTLSFVHVSQKKVTAYIFFKVICMQKKSEDDKLHFFQSVHTFIFWPRETIQTIENFHLQLKMMHGSCFTQAKHPKKNIADIAKKEWKDKIDWNDDIWNEPETRLKWCVHKIMRMCEVHHNISCLFNF